MKNEMNQPPALQLTSRFIQRYYTISPTLCSGSVAVFTIDTNLRICLYNPVFETMLQKMGIKLFVGMPLEKLFSSEDKPLFISILGNALSGKKLRRQIMFRCPNDGQIYDYELTTMPIQNENEEIFGAVFFLSDISIAKKISRKLQHQPLIQETKEMMENYQQNLTKGKFGSIPPSLLLE